MSTVTLTSDQICAIHSWPFPCEPRRILDPEVILHSLGATAVFVDRSGGATAFFSAANRSPAVDERLLWVAQATDAIINRAVTVQRAADTLEGTGDTVFSANRSAIGKFVDGVAASPPTCEPIPLSPVPGWWGFWFVFPPPPPPPPPNWESGEQLSGIDLLCVGTRFQAAAAALDGGSLRKEFLAAGARLFEVGAGRL